MNMKCSINFFATRAIVRSSASSANTLGKSPGQAGWQSLSRRRSPSRWRSPLWETSCRRRPPLCSVLATPLLVLVSTRSLPFCVLWVRAACCKWRHHQRVTAEDIYALFPSSPDSITPTEISGRAHVLRTGGVQDRPSAGKSPGSTACNDAGACSSLGVSARL